MSCAMVKGSHIYPETLHPTHTRRVYFDRYGSNGSKSIYKCRVMASPNTGVSLRDHVHSCKVPSASDLV
jgi:hypothetical protein